MSAVGLLGVGKDWFLGNGRLKGGFSLWAAAVALLFAACMFSASSARAAQEFELNDSRETAHGPLAGGKTYTAGIETLNDTDWFVFYVKTYSQIEFTASAAGSVSTSSYFYLYDRDGESLGCCEESFSAHSSNVIVRYPLTMAPGRYYLRVDGSQGARYKFTINPATSLTTSRECGEAIVAKDLVGPQLTQVNEDLAKNAEALATKAAAVHAAKAELRQASRKVQRLRAKVTRLRGEAKRLRSQSQARRKLRRVSARLRLARSEVGNAMEQLDEAKLARRPVWQERLGLDALARQHQQTIANADAQIATSC